MHTESQIPPESILTITDRVNSADYSPTDSTGNQNPDL